MKYDNEEKAILDAYQKGKMKLSTPTEKEIGEIRAMARKTLEMGIPYRTLISGIMHQYIEGELISKAG